MSNIERVESEDETTSGEQNIDENASNSTKSVLRGMLQELEVLSLRKDSRIGFDLNAFDSEQKTKPMIF